MADSKTKAVNGNHAPEKSQQKQSKLWQLLTLAKEVSKDADAILDYEKSIEGRKTLEQELESKSGENQRLRNLNDKIVREYTEHKAQANAKTETLFAEFEQKYKAYEAGKLAVEAAEKRVAEMEAKMQATETSQKEVEKLKQRLQAAEAYAKSHMAEIKELNAECELHRSQMEKGTSELDACKKKLSRAEKDLGESILWDFGTDDFKKLGAQLQELSKKCHDFAIEYFNDPDGAKDSAGEIHDLKHRFTTIPLTTNTTRAAAHMRCVVAEALIAQVLTSQIFVPFYLANDLKTAASTVLGIFADDERGRSIYRCQVLQSMTDSDEVNRVEEDIIRRASNEVRTTLHPLVVPYKQAGFYNAVPNLFREALRLWGEVQRSRELVVVETEDLNEALVGRYEVYDQGPGSPNAQGTKSTTRPIVSAVLFPRVVAGEDVIFEGMGMCSDQNAFLTALYEIPDGANGVAMKKIRRTSTASSGSPRRRE